MGAGCDPLDKLDPTARALVLDIVGIFVADALGAMSDLGVNQPCAAHDPAEVALKRPE